MNAADNVIAGYIAWRHGAIVGYGDTREAAYRHAWRLGISRADVQPANPWYMRAARTSIEERNWRSELELLRLVFACAVDGIDADWPFGVALDDDAADARLEAIYEELAEAERMAAVSETQVPAPEATQRRAITAFPSWLSYARAAREEGPCSTST